MPIEQPQSIRTIFFDAGFTLLHPFPSTAEICHRICQQFNIAIPIEQLKGRMHAAEAYFQQHMREQRQTWASEYMIEAFWIGYYTQLLKPFFAEHDQTRLYQLSLAIHNEF